MSRLELYFPQLTPPAVRRGPEQILASPSEKAEPYTPCSWTGSFHNRKTGPDARPAMLCDNGASKLTHGWSCSLVSYNVQPHFSVLHMKRLNRITDSIDMSLGKLQR